MSRFEGRHPYHAWLSELFKQYINGENEKARYLFWEELDKNERDPYSFLLFVAKEARFIFKSKQKPLSEFLFIIYKEWRKIRGYRAPSRQNKDDAMSYLVSFSISNLEIVNEIFELDTGEDRGYLVKYLKHLIVSKHGLKDAAFIASNLKLQSYILPTELLLPLLAADKLQVIDEYLKNNTEQQLAYAEMLNKLCGMTEEALFAYIQSDLGLNMINSTKFRKKALQKFCEKVIKKYELEPGQYPNIFKSKNLSSLNYLVHNRYKAPPTEISKWDSLIEAAVANNIWLQEQLIFMLAYNRNDIKSAAIWAQKCEVPLSSLPTRVRSEMERNIASSLPAPSKSATASKNSHRLNRYYDDECFDDYDDDDFMFASDDQDLEEDNKDSPTPIATCPEKINKYWDYPLKKENIKFICTCEELKSCMKVVFKAGNIIGFDGEWKPKYGRAGERDKLAIMQLAVKEDVYIIDILQFEQAADGETLLKELFKLLFTSEDTLRIGYGIDSDIKVITDGFPYVKEFVKMSRSFDDIAFVSKQIMTLPCIMDKLDLSDESKQNDRGLSNLVKQCFGKPLNKSYQVSNWEKRPLTEEQLRYAALDALCLIKIYDLFEDLVAEFKINVRTNAKSCSVPDSAITSYNKEQPSTGRPRRPRELLVVCDTMLQGLAKALRSCGVDAKYLQNGDEHMKTIQLCQQEQRIILTTGSPFHQLRCHVPSDMCMDVPEGSTEFQVSAVVRRYNVQITTEDIFSRCQVCNCDRFLKVNKEDMLMAYMKKKRIRPRTTGRGRSRGIYDVNSRNDSGIDFRYITINRGIPLQCEFIPPSVFDEVEVFFCCESCGKVYWKGSHYEQITNKFSRLIVDDDGNNDFESEDVDSDEQNDENYFDFSGIE